MAVTCARCGTQNPDGNQFCQACGTPLAVTAFAGPPATALPGPPAFPPPPPPGYQSPYYQPSAVGPQPPVHRTPWVLIISGIVVLVVIMAGCGTAFAVLGSRASNNQGSSGILPSPSPAGSPSPLPSPSPIGKSTTASNSGLSVTLPAGWTVQNKDDQTITVTNPNGDGSVSIGSGASSPSQTAQDNKATVDKFFRDKYPDTKNCAGSKTTNGSLNGASGIFWTLCFTLSGGGQSIQAGAPLFAGANADGSVYYVVLMLTSQTNMKSFIAEAAPVLQSIHWNLT
jgi:hypothetical protein